MFFKKILCLFIIFATCSLAAPTSGILSASSNGNTHLDSEEYFVLKQLGFISEISPEDEGVSMSVFAKNIAKMQDSFADFSDDAQTVDKLIRLNLFSDAAGFKSNPDKNITLGQALYSIITVLGYKSKAEVSGGYPSGYMLVGLESGMLEQVNSGFDEEISADAAIKLLYNTLHCNYMKLVSITNEQQNVYTSNENDVTILSELHGIHLGRGIVEANEHTGLYTESAKTASGRIKISGQQYYVEDIDTVSLLGYAVKFYYTERDSNIKLIMADKSLNTELTINAADISDTTTDKEIVYLSEKGKTLTARIASGAAIIYNGTAYPDFSKQTFQPDMGEVTLINNGSSGYNVVQIWEYRDCWVKDFDLDSYTVFDNYSPNIELSPNDSSKTVDVYDADRNRIYVIDIQPNDVISIAQSNEKTYSRILVSKNKIGGTIDSIGDVGDRQEVSIDGISVFVSKQYTKLQSIMKQDLYLGFSGTFYTNVFGEIAGVSKSVSDSMYVGYIIDAALAKDIHGSVEAKIFDSSGQMKTYQFAKKVAFDNQPAISGDAILNRLKVGSEIFVDDNGVPTSNIKRQLIQFELNADGYVKAVDLAYTDQPEPGESANSLRLDYRTERAMYRSRTSTFGGKAIMSSTTVSFVVSARSAVADDRDYITAGTSLFADNTFYAIEAYSNTVDNLTSEFIVNYPSGEIFAKEVRLVVDKIVTALDAEGETIRKLYGIVSDNSSAPLKVEYVIAEKADIPVDLGEGDYITTRLDFKGNVQTASYIYDYSEGKYVNGDFQTSGWAGQYRTAMMAVVSKISGVAKCYLGTDPTDNSKDTELVHVSKFRGITVFDGKRTGNRLYIGNINDIEAYDDVGETSSLIIIASYYGEDRGIVVYKR